MSNKLVDGVLEHTITYTTIVTSIATRTAARKLNLT